MFFIYCDPYQMSTPEKRFQITIWKDVRIRNGTDVGIFLEYNFIWNVIKTNMKKDIYIQKQRLPIPFVCHATAAPLHSLPGNEIKAIAGSYQPDVAKLFAKPACLISTLGGVKRLLSSTKSKEWLRVRKKTTLNLSEREWYFSIADAIPCTNPFDRFT